MDDISTLLAVARGDTPADLLLSGGQIVNVFSGEIERADIAIAQGTIAAIGPGYTAKQQIDLNGAFVSPGFIDAHVHIESSLCTPNQFAAAVLPRGVTTVIADPHEIANVAGVEGIRFMALCAQSTQLDVIVMAPSCVPATNMATSGHAISADDILALRRDGIVHGLAEVMNYPAVISGDNSMLDKLTVMTARPIDGHCPNIRGKALSAYIAAGVGSDHECITLDEAKEKLARGMYILIREATNARNLDALLPLITPKNSRRICFCTDDRTPVDLLSIGSVDTMIERAIAFGIDPIDAIRMATLNTAEWFHLPKIGAIAPGYKANLAIFDDLKHPRAKMVFTHGQQFEAQKTIFKATKRFECHIPWEKISLDIPARSNCIRVIGSHRDQLTTDHRTLAPKIIEGKAVADVERDLLKIAVMERHKSTGNIGKGFIQGFGLRRGAIAGTVAHDHHNLVTIGADDQSMLTAARAASSYGGGLAVAVGETIFARLPLPIAGLMSDQPVAQVAGAYRRLLAAAKELGSTLPDPFMAMSFMALEVIPSLKLTDRGLVDVDKFELVDLFA
jgi:adenine deaminase